MSERGAARERVAEYLRQRDLQGENYRGDCIHSLYADPSAEMADLLASDLRTLTAEPAPLPALTAARRRSLTRGSQEVSALSGMAREAVRRAVKAADYLEGILPPADQRSEAARAALTARRNAVRDAELTLEGLLQVMDIIEAHVDGPGDWARAAHALEYQAARARGPRADA
jgi:hypothetical protein